MGQMQDPTLTLVHGVIREWIGHAWLVKCDEVYDAVLDKFMPVEQYIAQERAVPERTYSAIEAAKIISRASCWGPWHETKGNVNGLLGKRGGR